MGYTDLVDPSVYVRFPAVGQPYDLLVWTTTPWTLVSNTAVAVHPEVDYAVVEVPGARPVLVAQPLVEGDRRPRRRRAADHPGPRAGGHRVRAPPRPDPARTSSAPGAHRIVLADYVTVDDGTGLVHQAPAFGAEDLEVARRYGLGVVNPVRPDGTFADERPAGRRACSSRRPTRYWSPSCERRGVLWSHVPYEHSYPLCWRCDTALLYYALPSWYIRTTAIKDRLLAENEATNWYPARIKHGRYGEWLRGNVDWALSRNRYWGTPLPIWICDDDGTHRVCVGSLAELGRAGRTGPLGARPAPAVRRRRGAALRRMRRPDAPRARGHRRLVRLRRDAVRAVGRAAPPARRVRGELPGAVHLRGDRPDARLVLHADGDRHPGVRQVLVRDGAVPRAAARRRGPQDEQAPRQRARPVRALRPPRRRRGALAHARRRLARGWTAGSATKTSKRSSARSC